MNRKEKRISRRDFTRSAALAAATAAVLPRELLAQQEKTPPAKPPAEQKPALSSAAQAEVDARAEAVFRKYGSRLSEEQKAEIRKNLADGQKGVETLRAFVLANADEPATVLHIRPRLERA